MRELPVVPQTRELGASPFSLSLYCAPTVSSHLYQCERCEARSYALHDPWHVFFKLPRQVDRPLVLQPPLPRLCVAY